MSCPALACENHPFKTKVNNNETGFEPNQLILWILVIEIWNWVNGTWIQSSYETRF